MERAFPFLGLKRYILFIICLLVLFYPGLFVPVAEAQIWNDFTVWYDGNGADSGHISEVKYKSGTNEVVLKKNEKSADGLDEPYVRNGCTFSGWSLYSDKNSVIAPVLPGGAEWDPVDVPVTWTDDKNGFVFYARWDCGGNIPLSPTAASQPPLQSVTNTPVPMLIAPDTVPTQTSGDDEKPPALLLAPEGRSSAKAVSNPDGGSQSSRENSLPLKFRTSIDELVSLPSTGITVPFSSLLSKPASVNYEPANMELQIPSLGITSDIVFVDFMDDVYPVEWLGMNAGLLEGTNVPGEGFSVIAGHNTLDADTLGPFALISAVNAGDHIFFRRADNRLLIFEVYSNEKISEYDYESLYKIGYRFDNTVTLMTCEDERIEGGYASRRIVSARLIQ